MNLGVIINHFKHQNIDDSQMQDFINLFKESEFLRIQLNLYNKLLNTKIKVEQLLFDLINHYDEKYKPISEFSTIEYEGCNNLLSNIFKDVTFQTIDDELLINIDKLIYYSLANHYESIERYEIMSNIITIIKDKNITEYNLKRTVEEINKKYIDVSKEDLSFIKTLFSSKNINETYNHLKVVTHTKLHNLRELTTNDEQLNKINETIERLNKTPNNIESEIINLYELSSNL